MSKGPIAVLQVGYYPTLLHTRQLMLTHAGYAVTSALGNEEAKRAALSQQFDVAVIGFSGSVQDRREILRWLKQNLESTPVVVLQANSMERFPEADVETLSENPETWLKVVGDLVKPQTGGGDPFKS